MSVLELVVGKMKMIGGCGWCFCFSDSFFYSIDGVVREGRFSAGSSINWDIGKYCRVSVTVFSSFKKIGL